MLASAIDAPVICTIDTVVTIQRRVRAGPAITGIGGAGIVVIAIDRRPCALSVRAGVVLGASIPVITGLPFIARLRLASICLYITHAHIALFIECAAILITRAWTRLASTGVFAAIRCARSGRRLATELRVARLRPVAEQAVVAIQWCTLLASPANTDLFAVAQIAVVA